MAVLKSSKLFQNHDFAFKIVPSRPLLRQAPRPSSCENVRDEQMVTAKRDLFGASKPVRRKRDLFGMEGLASQLKELTPHSPRPFQGPFSSIPPSAPREARRSSSYRPGRTLRGANSNWMRNRTGLEMYMDVTR